MAIHHMLTKQAQTMGFTLEEKGDHVRAFMASTAQQLFGVSAKDAVNQMIAFQNILKRNPEARIQHIEGTPLNVGRLRDTVSGLVSDLEPTTPVELYRNYDKLRWVKPTIVDNIEDTLDEVGNEEPETGESSGTTSDFVEDGEPKPPVDATPTVKRSEKGVPLDGAVAYAEGILAADNPFEEGSEEGDNWDAQWDQAADAAPEEDEDKKGGSVVASRYRTRYKEEGHPNHCGDWLATLLNNFCVGDKNTDLAMFERICGLNGVDTSKYNRTTPGWQGRVRMTGRNKLARVIFAAKKIVVPMLEGDGSQEIAAPADWLSAQRFNEPK